MRPPEAYLDSAPGLVALLGGGWTVAVGRRDEACGGQRLDLIAVGEACFSQRFGCRDRPSQAEAGVIEGYRRVPCWPSMKEGTVKSRLALLRRLGPTATPSV